MSGPLLSLHGLIYLFGAPRPGLACVKAIDFNDDGILGIPDVLGILVRTFLPGAADPPAPFPGCGVDRTRDPLPCEVSTAICRP